MVARITDHANILISKDVPAAISFWTGKLGFTVTGTWGEPAGFAILKRDGAYLMLGQARPEIEIVPYWKQRQNLWNAYFWVDDAKAMFEEIKGRGARIDYELCTQPYGVLEFGVQDLDGHDIAFGEVLRGAGKAPGN
jgi:uncharacterized glyoxalase superfamily protein PhnB